MSLINDALKRATEAQAKAENIPPPELKFRGVDPRENHPKRASWVLPSAITAVLIVAAFILWQVTQRQKSGNTGAQPSAGHEKQSGSFLGETMKVHAREDEPLPGAPLASAKPIETAQSEKVAVVAVSGTTIQETTGAKPTNSGALPAEIAGPAGPKLQAIVYNPANPSAIVSGKTVFAGDRLGEWRVFKIGRDHAVLIKTGETNVLKLGE